MDMKNLLICLIFISEIILNAHCENAFVQTPTAGNIKGKIQNIDGTNYRIYLGIPYAKPPLGDLRFKEPQPLDSKPASTVVDASKEFSKMCFQAMSFYPLNMQSEDCLYLNVFTPAIENSSNTKYPVMVWIHGGGFIMGSASECPMDGTLRNMVSRGIVFASFNYRLGPLGFYTTKSSVATGNYGLFDQVEALRWIQNNIQFFGGDPAKVTIFGESAGGASVSFLSISPLAKGLFNQAIMMSGSSLAFWAMMYDSDPTDMSGAILEGLGCRPNVSKSINAKCPYRSNTNLIKVSMDDLKQHEIETNCLRSKPASDIMNQVPKMFQPMAPNMRPRVDGKFLPELPEVLVKTRHPYTMMMGVVRDENAFWARFDPRFPTIETEFHNSPLGSIACNYFKYPKLVNITVNQHYGYSNSPSASYLKSATYWFQQSVKRESALWFSVPAYQDAIEAVNTNSKVYMYSYDWQNAVEFHNPQTNFSWKGASHASEIYSLFDTEKVILFGRDSNPSFRDKSYDNRTREVWGTLFTNFAKFGNPTPDVSVDGVTWEIFTKKDTNYLSIDMPKVKMANKFYESDVNLWTKFVPSVEESVVCE